MTVPTALRTSLVFGRQPDPPQEQRDGRLGGQTAQDILGLSVLICRMGIPVPIFFSSQVVTGLNLRKEVRGLLSVKAYLAGGPGLSAAGDRELTPSRAGLYRRDDSRPGLPPRMAVQ